MNGHVDIFRMLLAAGADPYAVDENGDTPYSVAIEHGYPEIAWILLLAAQ
jgi:ankyrin repeat protein